MSPTPPPRAEAALESVRLVEALRSEILALKKARDEQRAEWERAVDGLQRVSVLRGREEEILSMLRHNLLTARASIFAETDGVRAALEEIDGRLNRCVEHLRRAQPHVGADGPAFEGFGAIARELGRIDTAFDLFRGSLGGLEGAASRIEAIAKGLVDLGSVFTIRDPRQPVPILPILDSMKASYSVLAPEVEISLDLESDVVFRGDEIHFQFLLENLLSNALRQVRGNDGDLGRILVRTGRTAFSVYLQVCDSGPGTDRTLEDLARPLASASRAGGHGLGLWIVREVAELYGGELWMAGHGELGGATFTVTFPCAQPGP